MNKFSNGVQHTLCAYSHFNLLILYWTYPSYVYKPLTRIFSRYVAVEGMCTMIVDLNPRYWNKDKFRRPVFVAFSCFICFLAALPMVTKGGMYVFQVGFDFLLAHFDLDFDHNFPTVVVRYIWRIRTLLTVGRLLWNCRRCLGVWPREVLQWSLFYVWP